MRITTKDVQSAMSKTNIVLCQDVYVEYKNEHILACPIGVLYLAFNHAAASLLMQAEWSIRSRVIFWAKKIYGSSYTFGFIAGFDGAALDELPNAYHDGAVDGISVRNDFGFLPSESFESKIL